MRTRIPMIVVLLAVTFPAAVVAGPPTAGATDARPPGAAPAHRPPAHGGPVLDPSFGNDGLVTTDLGAGDNVVDMALQPDGRLVAVGGGYNTATPNGGFAVVRYLPDGRLDDSFGESGVVSTDGGDGSSAHPFTVVVRPDGRILVAGGAQRGIGWAPVVVSYLPDGTLDDSFGPGGRRFPLGEDTHGRVADMLLSPNGAILLAIEAVADDGEDPVLLARLRPDGRLDPSFGDGGLARFDPSPREFLFVSALASAPDGGILVAGLLGWWGNLPELSTDVLLARFSPNGRVDRSFGVGGRVVRDLTGPDGTDGVSGLAVARDGRVVLAVGLRDFPAGQTERSRAGLLRYLPDGRPDPGFGRRGFAPADLPARSWGLGSPTIRADGRILTVGGTQDDGTADLALAQFRPDGRPDGSFGRRGVVLTDVNAGSERGTVLLVRPDGRLLVGGTSGAQGDSSFAVFRFLP